MSVTECFLLCVISLLKWGGIGIFLNVIYTFFKSSVIYGPPFIMTQIMVKKIYIDIFLERRPYWEWFKTPTSTRMRVAYRCCCNRKIAAELLVKYRTLFIAALGDQSTSSAFTNVSKVFQVASCFKKLQKYKQDLTLFVIFLFHNRLIQF